MELNDRKEQFSFAYLHAVASVAGFGISGLWPAPDRDSIDLTVSGRGTHGTIKLPSMQVYITLLPIHSGYRHEKTLELSITTRYSQVYQRMIAGEEFVKADGTKLSVRFRDRSTLG
jgi:hypothetical protein